MNKNYQIKSIALINRMSLLPYYESVVGCVIFTKFLEGSRALGFKLMQI